MEGAQNYALLGVTYLLGIWVCSCILLRHRALDVGYDCSHEVIRLVSIASVCAGMVTETGEATARFLKSIARGEIDPKDTINQQAQLGLKRVRSMRAEDRPGDCRLASRQLVRGFTF